MGVVADVVDEYKKLPPAGKLAAAGAATAIVVLIVLKARSAASSNAAAIPPGSTDATTGAGLGTVQPGGDLASPVIEQELAAILALLQAQAQFGTGSTGSGTGTGSGSGSGSGGGIHPPQKWPTDKLPKLPSNTGWAGITRQKTSWNPWDKRNPGGVPLRFKAGDTHTIQSIIPYGARLTILGPGVSTANGLYYPVSYNGQSGFLSHTDVIAATGG